MESRRSGFARWRSDDSRGRRKRHRKFFLGPHVALKLDSIQAADVNWIIPREIIFNWARKVSRVAHKTIIICILGQRAINGDIFLLIRIYFHVKYWNEDKNLIKTNEIDNSLRVAAYLGFSVGCSRYKWKIHVLSSQICHLSEIFQHSTQK